MPKCDRQKKNWLFYDERYETRDGVPAHNLVLLFILCADR